MDDKDEDLSALELEVQNFITEIEQKSEENKKTNPEAFTIKFSDSAKDSLVKLFSKSQEDLELENKELQRDLLNTITLFIKRLKDSNTNDIQIESSGTLYGEPAEPDSFMLEEYEKFGFSKLTDDLYTWNSCWTDVFIRISETERRWLFAVQNKEAKEDMYRFDVKITNECLKDAYKDKSVEDILHFQQELERLEQGYSKEVDFRLISLKTSDYLTKEHVLEAVKIWVSNFCTDLKEFNFIYK